MTRQMPAGSQVAFAKDWLERQNIEAQTIDGKVFTYWREGVYVY